MQCTIQLFFIDQEIPTKIVNINCKFYQTNNINHLYRLNLIKSVHNHRIIIIRELTSAYIFVWSQYWLYFISSSKWLKFIGLVKLTKLHSFIMLPLIFYLLHLYVLLKGSNWVWRWKSNQIQTHLWQRTVKCFLRIYMNLNSMQIGFFCKF